MSVMLQYDNPSNVRAVHVNVVTFLVQKAQLEAPSDFI